GSMPSFSRHLAQLGCFFAWSVGCDDPCRSGADCDPAEVCLVDEEGSGACVQDRGLRELPHDGGTNDGEGEGEGKGEGEGEGEGKGEGEGEPECGNGDPEGDEECDDGDDDPLDRCDACSPVEVVGQTLFGAADPLELRLPGLLGVKFG